MGGYDSGMQTRPLGRTGLNVTPLGYGAASVAGADAPTMTRLLNTALDSGMNIIDTAECYTRSEETIGAAIGHRRSEYLIFTKVGHDGASLGFADWDPRLVLPSIERSLARLRTDRVELVQLHTCSLAQLQAGDLIAELRKARDAGKCRFIGFSGDREEAAWAVRCGAFDTIQTSVNIADQQSIDLVLPEARRRNMGIIAKRPIANAAWSTGDQPPTVRNHHTYWERLRALDYPLVRDGRAPEVALRFTISVEGVATALVGTSKPERWLEYFAHAQQGPLPAADVQAIRQRWAQVSKPEWVGQT